ncbi:cytochrome P450 monooxygenase-like protein 51 [Elsinoe australis]|uniref:Cytochrome P450 monooxygenase-like protein 51 n=1 Tax=Elsinoe australis TaxID=40998 RepID=A0A4U7APL8_9PEZI|nr:cytochrome P450 monooxygenase-like protein 51 [Elsinoe australis]
MPPTQRFLAISTVGAYVITHFFPEQAIRQSFAWTAAAIFSGAFFGWIVWAVLIYPNFFSPLRHLPSPPNPTLFMGHSERIMKEPTGIPMRDWANEVPNDGLIRYLHWFNNERVLITSERALSEVLVTKNYDFIKPNLIRTGLARILGVGILLAEGDEHKHLSPAFAFRHVKDLYPTFWGKSIELIERVSQDIANPDPSHEKEANVREVGDYTSRATLDIIGVAGMGRDFGTIKEPGNPLSHHYKTIFQPPRGARYLQMLNLILPSWFIQNLPLKRNQEIVAARKTIRETCSDLIAAKRARKSRTDFDILSVAIESGGFNDEELINQMMTFLVAGHETTSTAMLWAIYLLCQKPEVQTRLRAEIHANIASPRTKAGRTISSQTIDNLPYLSAVLNEVLRVWAPVSLTMRVTAKDTSVLGQPIPKGTTVILCPWATNNSYASWGPDAQTFNPERWLKEGQANKSGAESNFSFLTFLHGPRSCIGEKFARAEFACLLAAWIGRFECEFETPGFVVEIGGGVTSKPKGGLWVRLKECEDW